MFEQSAMPILEKEFGNKVEVTMVGFPVIPGPLPTAFEMYEQAKVMGKGNEMKRVLFRTIHQDKTHMLDRVIREMLIKEVGLDVSSNARTGLPLAKPASKAPTSRPTSLISISLITRSSICVLSWWIVRNRTRFISFPFPITLACSYISKAVGS